MEIEPGNTFAPYACGVIEWRCALELMWPFASYPHMNDDERRILGAETSPLLDESAAATAEARAWDLKGGGNIFEWKATITVRQVAGERIAPRVST
jgi:hypothetical protein